MIEHTVPEGVSEMQVRRYIRRAWPMLPEHVVREAFKKRDIKLNGARCAADAPVRAGDRLVLFLNAEFPLEVLFDDGRLLAVSKPQGLPIDVDAQGIGADTLLSRLRAHNSNARLLHRLDAQTGGVVLSALDEKTLEKGLLAFKRHEIRKTYRAVALEKFSRAQGEYEDYLLKDARRAKVRIVKDELSGAKKIITRYRVLDNFGEGLSLVELEPVTGRTHQLRAQMAFHGHPLLGDDKYGDRSARAYRLHLWCREIAPLGGALGEYEGQSFAKKEPDWGKALGCSPDCL